MVTLIVNYMVIGMFAYIVSDLVTNRPDDIVVII